MKIFTSGLVIGSLIGTMVGWSMYHGWNNSLQQMELGPNTTIVKAAK